MTGNELSGIYDVIVTIVKANGEKMRSNRSNQFFIVNSSDDLTEDDVIEGLEENIIYLNTAAFIVGNGRGITSIDKTSTVGLVDTYTITYSDNTTSTFEVTNGTSAVVNDLTTGGIDKALSAEQGKVLKGITDSIIGVEQIDLPLMSDTYGYYTDGGVLAATTNPNYRNTGKIAVPSGYDVVTAYTAATTTMCAIAFFDENDSFISASSVVGVGQYMHLYTAAIPVNAATFAISLRKVGGELNYYYAYMAQSDISLKSLSERIDVVGKDAGYVPVYLATSNQYVNTSGSITATSGDKYKTTEKVEIPMWCNRVRCRTASSTSMCAIAFFDEAGDFMSDDKVVVGAGLTTSIQTFDVAVPLGAKYLICSTIYATAFRCIMYSDILPDDWLPQLLIFGDSITMCSTITTSFGNTTSYLLKETTPANKWPSLLISAINAEETRSYAMDGGHWCDNANATEFQNLSEQISVAVADKLNPNGVFMSADFVPNVIILALGTNDAGSIKDGDYTLGDVDTTMAKSYANLDMTIFSDAVRKNIEDIRTTWPTSDIYVSLPIYRHSDAVMPYVEQVRDVLRAITPKYGCRVIEAGALSGIYRYNQGDLLRDGLHPNQAGQDKLAEVIIGHVSNGLGSVHIASGGSSVTVVDNLTSTSTTSALSANQGRVLNEAKANKRTVVTTGSALAADTYLELGTTDAPAPTLPATYTDADEFLFSFTCSTASCSLTLPVGVELGSELDFSADVAAGRKFQVSIMDGIALYTYIDPS